MNTDELRYFIEAAKEEHLGRAAKTLGTTQSTLSHAIRRLEREFDCKLFSKQGKTLRLTMQGKKFSERANEILRRVHDLKREVGAGASPLNESFKAAGTLGEASQILAYAFSKLRAASHSTLDMTSMRSAEVLRKVAARDLDFGLCFEPDPHPQIQMRAVGVSYTHATVCDNHPILKLPKAKRLEALAKYPVALPKHLIGVSNCAAHPIFEAIFPADKKLKTQFQYDSYEMAAQMVSSSEAWALLPETTVKSSRHSFVTLFPKYEKALHLVLIWHNDSETPVIAELEKILKTVSKKFGWKTSPALLHKYEKPALSNARTASAKFSSLINR